MRLSQRDFRSLQEAIFHLYEPRNLDALQRELPRILLKLCHCECLLWKSKSHRATAGFRVAVRKTSSLTRRQRFLIHELRPHIEQAFRTAELISALQRFKSAAGPSASLERIFRLSGRECEVAYWLAQGKSNPEIGIILGLSRRTIEKHVEHILPKLGVENRATAAAMLARINTGPATIPSVKGNQIISSDPYVPVDLRRTA